MIIKVGNNEFWNTRHEPSLGADGMGLDGCDARYNICISARNIGKSYAGKQLAIDNFLERGEEFALIRSFADDLKTSFTDNYWADMYSYFYPRAHEMWPEYKSFGIVAWRGAWHVKGYTEDEKYEDLGVIGRWFALNTAGRYKSQSYPNTSMAIMEEFIPEPGTSLLNDMTSKLMSVLSTIFRGRKDFKVYLWANAIDPNNTIFEEWQIDPKSLKQGEIKVFDYYDEKGNITNRVAVDWPRELLKEEESYGWQNFGRSQEVMLQKGTWQSKNYRQLSESIFDQKKPELSLVLDYKFIHLYLYAFRNKDGTYDLGVFKKRMTNKVEYVTLYDGQTNVKRRMFNIKSRFGIVTNLKNFIYHLYLNDLCFYEDNLAGIDFERVLEVL